MAATKLIWVSGKGGTGKSAVAAAIALARARAGHRVLAIDMGRGLGLGAHLGADRLSYEPTEHANGVFALGIDRSLALDEYLRLQLKIPRGAPTKQLTRALAALAETAPGVREIISIGKPIHETWKAVWDAVIVDTPSLGQLQSYLRAPATITELVPSGNVRRQANALASTIADAESTGMVLVTTAAELPVNETAEAVAAMRAEHLCPAPTVIVNRVVEASGLDDDAIDRLPQGAARDAAYLQLHTERDQARWAGSIDHALELPHLMGFRTPLEVALQLSDLAGRMA